MKFAMPVLFTALLTSAMGLVYVRYESRLAFAELHRLDRERDELNVEYGKLLLERATWSLNDLVERQARERLSMHRPAPDSVATLVIPARDQP